jgi:hypothetical protein
MTKDGPEIPLLTSSNYWEWAVRVEDRLVAKDLDRYIREGVQRITDVEVAQDRKAISLIRSYVSLELLPYLLGVGSAREAWTMLSAVNTSSLQAKKLGLEEKLLGLKMSKAEDVTEYCARARRIQLELRSAGETVADHRLARCILHGLPMEFEGVRNILLFQAATEVNLDAMVTHLKVAEERMSRSVEQDATALAADKEKKRKKSMKKDAMKKVVCFQCGKPGHFKRNCPEGSRSADGNRESGQGVALTAWSGPDHGSDQHTLL